MAHATDLIWGRHPVSEALTVEGRIKKIFIANGVEPHGVNDIIAAAQKLKITLERVDRKKLDELTHNANHQGVLAFSVPWEYADIQDAFRLAEERSEPPFLLILDSVQDVNNLGSLIRAAEAFGAHGVILPEHRAAGVTPAVIKNSAGAVEHLPVILVTNLTQTIEYLKKQNVWVFGLAGEAKTKLEQVDLNTAVALVIGNEESGIRRIVRESCDALVKIPMFGKVNSLNAATAGSIALYAAKIARSPHISGKKS